MRPQRDKWQKVKFEEIAHCVEEHTKNPSSYGLERFIGLENVDGESLRISGFGMIKDGTTFTKIFLEGDILFGKRRPYLKKVAVADFNGICSGDILVFRHRYELILPELLHAI
jgi:type I restriction enzyme S subunit